MIIHKCMGMQIWPCRKKYQRSSQDHHFNNFDRLWVPIAVYQDSASKLSWFWRCRLLSVFTIYRHGGHFVQCCRTIWTICQYLINRRSYLKTIENGSSGFTKLSAFRTFVRFALVWFCLFPLLLGAWEGLRLVIVALPGLTFFRE